MPSRVIGQQPKPRALIFGFDDAAAKHIGSLFPTWRSIETFDDVVQREWDVVVTTLAAELAEPHLYVIGLGCRSYTKVPAGMIPNSFGWFHSPTQPEESSKATDTYVRWADYSRATMLEVPERLPVGIEHLVNTELVPLVRRQDHHYGLGLNNATPKAIERWTNIFEPFLSTAQGQHIAGRFLRPGGNSECWCFPDYAVPLTPRIVQVAVREWNKRDPEMFLSVQWVNEPPWRTTAENRIASELHELEARRAATLAELDEQQEELVAALSAERRSAEDHERLLLTSRGDGLVRAVTECLLELGFSITNMDDVYPAGDRREDLQVSAREAPEWIALVEVRGYRRGAQSDDLQRIGRFSKRYLRDNGREADALWYVVNQFNEDSPAQRPPVLASKEPELAEFANDDGVAIDTTHLFRLWMAVRDGRLPADEARSSLMQAPGRFIFDD
jgi:hypothetical protein